MIVLFLLVWVLATLLAYVMAGWCRSTVAYLLPLGVWAAGLVAWGVIFGY